MTPPAIVYSVPAQASIDLGRLVEAIRAVETVRGQHRRGRHNERGPFQFKRSTWEECTSLPWSYADDPKWAAEVCRFRLNKLRYQLLERRIEPTPENLIACWNVGLTGFLVAPINAEARDYTRRASALYFDGLKP